MNKIEVTCKSVIRTFKVLDRSIPLNVSNQIEHYIPVKLCDQTLVYFAGAKIYKNISFQQIFCIVIKTDVF